MFSPSISLSAALHLWTHILFVATDLPLSGMWWVPVSCVIFLFACSLKFKSYCWNIFRGGRPQMVEGKVVSSLNSLQRHRKEASLRSVLVSPHLQTREDRAPTQISYRSREVTWACTWRTAFVGMTIKLLTLWYIIFFNSVFF